MAQLVLLVEHVPRPLGCSRQGQVARRQGALDEVACLAHVGVRELAAVRDGNAMLYRPGVGPWRCCIVLHVLPHSCRGARSRSAELRIRLLACATRSDMAAQLATVAL